MTAAWSLFLLLNNALVPWVEYYLIFSAGHAATGTLPLDLVDNDIWDDVFWYSEAIVVIGLGVTLARLVGRRRLTPPQWVLAGAAILAGLYSEKGLARFDAGHIGQVTTVAVTLSEVVLVRAWFEVLKPETP